MGLLRNRSQGREKPAGVNRRPHLSSFGSQVRNGGMVVVGYQLNQNLMVPALIAKPNQKRAGPPPAHTASKAASAHPLRWGRFFLWAVIGLIMGPIWQRKTRRA
ncbi:hypothetical protein [Bradyrhizobium erythrophlei]|jgi:hypothetical protein|uniref:Uncharacterized protein n=1 Tax=Bradyrhizobium erythrophlei TaxID=1437360 RepID=A0A1M5MUX1_9BRAD|nr:hypothetical protein [Bradyrhizobium erythrophlei]SHG80699.1 hypothetical protein SAMN05443248_2722 [Bradyrhizobium erythrophlei]